VTFYAPQNCPGAPYVSVGPCAELGPDAAGDGPDEEVEGNTICTEDADCPSGSTCTGMEGCATHWTCVRRRRCTRDLVPFCSCEGATFAASSTCPGRPFAHRGECGAAAPVLIEPPSPITPAPMPHVDPRRDLGDPS
jgi:hypothetical protein